MLSKYTPLLELIPIFNKTIPTRGNNSTRFMWLPSNTRTAHIMRLELFIHLCRLPLPETDIPTRVSGTKPLAIRRESDIGLKSRISMPRKHLPSLRTEFISRSKHTDRVIQRLSSDVFSTGMEGDFDKRMHVWLSNVFDWDVDAVFPCSEGFIVAGGDESFILVAEGYGVDCAEMVIVFLDDFTGSDVILQDFFVGKTDEEFILVFLCGVEFDTVGQGTHVPSVYDFACFCVP